MANILPKLNTWSISKILLFIASLIIFIICGYLLLKEPIYRLPIASLNYYDNKIYTVNTRKPIQPIKIPYTKLQPFTFSFWMSIDKFQNNEETIQNEYYEKKPKAILYIGNGTLNNVLLLLSLKSDTSVYNVDSLGYQMVNEFYLNNMYKNTNNHGMIRYRVNEWVYYTYVYLENTIQIYQNGKLIENINYHIPIEMELNNYHIYFTMPEVVTNDFEDIPKKIYNIKWYSYIVNQEMIERIYNEDKKKIETLINKEKNVVNRIKERCSK